MKIKKSQLKRLIKEIIKESIGGSSVLRHHNIYLADGEIPGLTRGPTEMEITADIAYDYDPGEEARGMSGPPEHSSPGSAPQTDVYEGQATSIHLYPEGGQKTSVKYEQLRPQQQQAVDAYVEAYVESKEGQEALSRAVESDIESQANDVDEPDDWPHEDWEDR